MRNLDRNLLVWGTLVMVTLASVAFAELLPWRIAGIVAIFAAAVIKGQLVAVNFMETPHALPHWNRLYRGWIAAIGVMLCGGILLSAWQVR